MSPDALDQQLKNLPPVAPPPGLRERILEDAPAELPPATVDRPSVLPLAATFLLAVGLAYLLGRSGPGPRPSMEPRPPMVAVGPSPPEPHPVTVPPLEDDEFHYDPANRRDPYVSFWDQRPSMASQPSGVSGMVIAELHLKGIVVTPREQFAVVQGADRQGYSLRVGDELQDGRVKAIDRDRVVFLRRVTDTLSLSEFTEVVKRLQPGLSPGSDP